MGYPTRVTVEFNKDILVSSDLLSFSVKTIRRIEPYTLDVFPELPLSSVTHPYQFIMYRGNSAYPPILVASDEVIYVTVDGSNEANVWVKGNVVFYTLTGATYTYKYTDYIPNGDGTWHMDSNWNYAEYVNPITAFGSTNIGFVWSLTKIYYGLGGTEVCFDAFIFIETTNWSPAGKYLDPSLRLLYLYFDEEIIMDGHTPSTVTLSFTGTGLVSVDGGVMKPNSIEIPIQSEPK